MIKRQIYGRADFALLRKCVLPGHLTRGREHHEMRSAPVITKGRIPRVSLAERGIVLTEEKHGHPATWHIGKVQPAVRWPLATLVTVAAFSVVTWTCGTLILPHVMNDPTIRWGMAGGLGTAVAALAALWGHSYATAHRSRSATSSSPGPAPEGSSAGSGNVRNQISGGSQRGPVFQGRDFPGSMTFGGPSKPSNYSADNTS